MKRRGNSCLTVYLPEAWFTCEFISYTGFLAMLYSSLKTL
jgi:hypothetical protein